ncbi:MAG TPA: AI-2E family transporter [bacterium]|nr:AI-2E family transporter [bacterium]
MVAALSILFVGHLLSLIVTIFVSLLLVLLFSPFLDAMNRMKIPDGVGVTIIFLVILAFFSFALSMIVPLIAGQLLPLVDTVSIRLSDAVSGSPALPPFIAAFVSETNYETIIAFIQANASSILSGLKSGLTSLSRGGIDLAWGVGSTIFSTAFVVVFTFFAALDRKRIIRAVFAVMPDQWASYFSTKRAPVYAIIRAWVVGQSKLAFLLAALVFSGLHLLRLFGIDIPDKFALAVVAGCMEFIPYLGTVLSFLPALLIALGISTEAVIAVSILYAAIQQIEGNVLAPFVV